MPSLKTREKGRGVSSVNEKREGGEGRGKGKWEEGGQWVLPSLVNTVIYF